MRTIATSAIFTLILAVSCAPLSAQTAPSTFLFLLESKGTPTGAVHVFSENALTGAIIEVPGSPFNAGLIPVQLVVDPTGRFVYVANEQSQDITGFSVDPVTGALTGLPGSGYAIGTTPQSMAIDPTGRFLYVSSYFVVNGQLNFSLNEYTIDGVTGVLTAAAGSPFQEGNSIVAITFNQAGDYAYMSQGSPDPGAFDPIQICSVDFGTGAFTPISSFQPAARGSNEAVLSPNGGFLYSIDPEDNLLDAYAISLGGSAVNELTASPYAVPNIPYSLAEHPSGNFLYVVNENQPYQTNYTPSQYDGGISGFAVDPETGALTQLPASPFAAGINPVSIVVDPAGSFAFSTSTTYTTGYTGFAQIMEFSIDPTSGVLTPFPGAPWTDPAQSNGAQLAISSGPATATNPTPMISSLSPSSTTATATAFTLQVSGANFVPGATVYYGAQPRATTFVSSTQLNATILASDIANDGTAVVFVFNPLPGGGASTSVEFPVSASSPVISSISPPSVPAGQLQFNLYVTGLNFVTSSIVNFNGAALATMYFSPTSISGVIPTADVVAQGTASITVTTPSNGVPGGGTSNSVTFTISSQETQPVVTSISPTSTAGGGPAFTLTVNGSGFVQGSQVSFNQNNVASTLISPNQLTAVIPASAIEIAGYPNVVVTNNPGGLVSLPLPFEVTNPQPGGGSIIPPSLPAGSNALTLDVSGTGFTPGSVVLVNGAQRVTTYVSSTSLSATLLSGDLSQGGTLNITVMNPPPGGGTTSAISFAVADYSVTPPSSPSSVSAGGTANFALTISPSNGAFSNSVTFSVSQLPPGAAASFTPSATITPGAAPQAVMLSIVTTPHSASAAPFLPDGPWPALPLLYLAGLALAIVGFWIHASVGKAQRLASQFLLALLLLAATGLIACGEVGTGSPSSQVNPATGTPAGTYTLTVAANSGGVSHSTTVTLKVM